MNNIESPRMDDAGIEHEIVSKGKTAPRVTPADIEGNIIHEVYFTAGEAAVAFAPEFPNYKPLPQSATSLNLLTFCVLVLQNGFTVTGESACASPENFDAEIGRLIARSNAVQKVWPLMGYELRTKLAGGAA